MGKAKMMELLTHWNFWKGVRETGILRQHYLDQMKRLLATGQVVTIMAVRRADKFTLMLQYMKALIDEGLQSQFTLYVNLEDPRWGELSVQLLQAIWEAYLEWREPKTKPFLFLDEIHLVPAGRSL